MNISRRFVVLAVLVLTAASVFAQGNSKGHEAELRTVRGTVVDKDEAPVDAAVVYLKNLHTQDIVTHISDPDGQFRFSGLDLNTDYEVHAEHQGLTSVSRAISSFDTRKEFVVTLKLDHTKKPAK